MPPIYVLNHPPHPFWDFVQEMNEHPFFRQTPPPPPANGADQPEAARSGAETHDNQQATPNDAADPPEVDPATLRAQAREARHEARRQEHEARRQEHETRRREMHARMQERHEARDARRAQRGFGHHGGWHGFAQPPFMMGGGPGPGFGPGNQESMPPFPPQPNFGFGWGGRGGRGGRGGHGGHHGPRGHHHGGQHPAGAPFNLGKFLNDLGDKIGIDLQGAAEGLGIDRFMPSSASPDVDFEPKIDIFELAQEYIIHASLPGARKDDVGVDWDGEHSVLRIAGVVHRPDADEEMLQHLVVDGRKREVGVFEKTVRLGTQREPASIDIAGIKAKMSDGVLVVHVPKIKQEHHKRDVPISSAPPSPPRYEDYNYNEDEDMYDITPENVQNKHPVLQPQNVAGIRSRTLTPEPSDTALPVRDVPPQQEHPAATEQTIHIEPAQSQEEKGKSREVEDVVEKEKVEDDPIPGHYPTSEREVDDWERSDSEEEGDYVKINVE